MAAIKGIADAMSDVLSLVRMRSELVCANEYTAPFSLSFRTPVAHFHIVERGRYEILQRGGALWLRGAARACATYHVFKWILLASNW